MRSIAGALAGLLLAGCTSPQVIRCMNGAICRDDQACTEKMPVTCGVPEEVAVCYGQANHTACTRADGLPGSCIENRCGACDTTWLECRYQGWTAMTVPASSSIHALSAVAPDDLYAVTDTEVLHYDGTTWAVREKAASGLKSVWAADASNVFVVAVDGRVFRNDLATVEHTIANVQLRQVWATGLDNIIAVGSAERITARLDNTWLDSPVLAMPKGTLQDVWGTKARAYVVGQNGLLLAGQGASWTDVPTSGLPTTTDALFGIWGASPSDMYIVGGNAALAGLVYHFDGTAISAMQLPMGTPQLFRVWGSGSTNIYAVGDAGTVMHFDGTSWSAMKTLNAVVRIEAVTGISTDVGRDIYVAAGANIWKLSEPR